jgi:hypothetical protein
MNLIRLEMETFNNLFLRLLIMEGNVAGGKKKNRNKPKHCYGVNLVTNVKC